MTQQILSKSKYLIGLQCLEYLWTVFHEPSKIPKPTRTDEHKFEQGSSVGEYAKKLFPQGIDIPCDDFKTNLSKTSELLLKRKPLFEPGFLIDNLFSRGDILVPVGTDKWDIVEVKSSTKVKNVNIEDVSFQKYVYERAGLKIRKCFLMHINNEYIKNGKLDVEKLFVKEDITKEVEEAIKDIDKRILPMFEVIMNKEKPSVEISHDCGKPYDCPLKDFCYDFEHDIFSLYRGGKKSYGLYDSGVNFIKDIPADFKLNAKQKVQLECLKNKKTYVHKEAIKHFLNVLVKPLYFLDFETFSTAIPIFDGTKPYQQVPFQFSLHIKEGTKLKHESFLASGSDDPRKKFLLALKETLGDSGSIIVYNQSFEKKILKQLVEESPKYEKWVQSILDRIVDLWDIFRNFYYYDSKQCGSASIKYVLPALTGKSYKGMEIGDGQTASLEFLDIIRKKKNEKEAEKTRKNLEKYCELDTKGMVWVLEKLEGVVK